MKGWCMDHANTVIIKWTSDQVILVVLSVEVQPDNHKIPNYKSMLQTENNKIPK